MTEDEVRAVNRMQARITALQVFAICFLCEHLKEADDPDEAVAAVLTQIREYTDRVGPEDVMSPMVAEEIGFLLEESRKLLG